ncbi:MAG: hypothetical protein V2I62_07375 [Bacteroidales bacterium]|jgi:hypothetical protein|nr:hypothetical protein [Bacteroidales bacterium]
MKNQKLILITALFVIPLLFTSCKKDKNENPADLTSEVTGTYKGSITPSDDPANSNDAILEITKVDESTVQLNMMSEHLDTAFMLNLYENADSIMVCLTGEQFNNEYGHRLDEDHHMMGDNNHMDWNHHMDEQHEPGDMHYGGFDMEHHTFSYSLVPGGQSDVSYQFEGTKEQ